MDASKTVVKVATANIVDSAVTTAKIADLNVTTGKLAADAVTVDKRTALHVINTSSYTCFCDGATGNNYTTNNPQVSTTAFPKGLIVTAIVEILEKNTAFHVNDIIRLEFVTSGTVITTILPGYGSSATLWGGWVNVAGSNVATFTMQGNVSVSDWSGTDTIRFKYYNYYGSTNAKFAVTWVVHSR